MQKDYSTTFIVLGILACLVGLDMTFHNFVYGLSMIALGLGVLSYVETERATKRIEKKIDNLACNKSPIISHSQVVSHPQEEALRDLSNHDHLKMLEFTAILLIGPLLSSMLAVSNDSYQKAGLAILVVILMMTGVIDYTATLNNNRIMPIRKLFAASVAGIMTTFVVLMAQLPTQIVGGYPWQYIQSAVIVTVFVMVLVLYDMLYRELFSKVFS